MNILYGCFSQGQGHLAKAAVLVPMLQSRGHHVRVVTSGQPVPPAFQFPAHVHFPSFPYIIEKGRTQFRKTGWSWLRNLPWVMGAIGRLRQMIRDDPPDLIVSDFEPLTTSPLLEAPCETVSLCRQVALIDPAVGLPAGMAFERQMTRTIIRFFTQGADRFCGYHYEPASSRCVPPLVRTDLETVTPSEGDHLFIYNYHHDCEAGGRVEDLMEWAEARRQEVRVYGYPEVPRGRVGHVLFQPTDRLGLLEDLARSRAVMTTGGLTLAVEAYQLGKPVCILPIPGQWEQLVNASHLDAAGVGRMLTRWDYDAAMEQPFSRLPAVEDEWLRTPAERIISHVLAG